MSLPASPVTLQPEQIAELHSQLRKARHNVNNSLMLMSAAAEMFYQRPEIAEDMIAKIGEEAKKATETIRLFSKSLEATLAITPD
ncbi:MAG TPA: hypothetical protein VHH73_14805 [Verrucomicrobiae bacterium]|nr:hypothetical protein [Verrucomicrobiae bacterium]